MLLSSSSCYKSTLKEGSVITSNNSSLSSRWGDTGALLEIQIWLTDDDDKDVDDDEDDDDNGDGDDDDHYDDDDHNDDDATLGPCYIFNLIDSVMSFNAYLKLGYVFE